ncbi:hypothetical protein [Colwellia sp. MEBiC06753]
MNVKITSALALLIALQAPSVSANNTDASQSPQDSQTTAEVTVKSDEKTQAPQAQPADEVVVSDEQMSEQQLVNEQALEEALAQEAILEETVVELIVDEELSEGAEAVVEIEVDELTVTENTITEDTVIEDTFFEDNGVELTSDEQSELQQSETQQNEMQQSDVYNFERPVQQTGDISIPVLTDAKVFAEFTDQLPAVVNFYTHATEDEVIAFYANYYGEPVDEQRKRGRLTVIYYHNDIATRVVISEQDNYRQVDVLQENAAL